MVFVWACFDLFLILKAFDRNFESLWENGCFLLRLNHFLVSTAGCLSVCTMDFQQENKEGSFVTNDFIFLCKILISQILF